MSNLSRRGLPATDLAMIAVPGLARHCAAAPAAYGATTSRRQRAWHRRERYAFIHFSINTFTGKEWSYGDESPALFDPTDFDPDQIVHAARSGGFGGRELSNDEIDGHAPCARDRCGALRRARLVAGDRRAILGRAVGLGALGNLLRSPQRGHSAGDGMESVECVSYRR